MAQVSTAVSDLALAISCAVGIRFLNANRTSFSYSKWSLATTMLAATLGVFRFGMGNPPELLVKAHKFASRFAGSVGLCLMACEFYHQGQLPWIGIIEMWASLGIAMLWPLLDSKTHELWSHFVGSMAVVSIVLFCAVHKNLYGFGAAILVIIAGTVVGTEGVRIGMPAVDVFHYVLVISNYFYVRSFISTYGSV